jgi:hypothetical protein
MATGAEHQTQITGGLPAPVFRQVAGGAAVLMVPVHAHIMAFVPFVTTVLKQLTGGIPSSLFFGLPLLLLQFFTFQLVPQGHRKRTVHSGKLLHIITADRQQE